MVLEKAISVLCIAGVSEYALCVRVHVCGALSRQSFLGGCPRDFSDCPRAWRKRADGRARSLESENGSDRSLQKIAAGTCEPPPTYAGLCGPVRLFDMSLADVEALEFCRSAE